MTTTTIHPGATIQQILEAHPGTRTVFDLFGAHACCGGDVPLAVAAERDGIDLEALLAALREAAGAGTSAPHRDTSAPIRPDVARLTVR